MSRTILVATAIATLIAAAILRRVPRSAHIVDGDTIKVNGHKWRLAGFDAPERDQPGGAEATEHLRPIIEAGWMIGLVYGIDPYRRLLVRCYTLRGPLSWRMIGSGHAHATGALGVIPMLWARILRRGIWRGGRRVVAPSNWRATHPKPMPPAVRTLRWGKGFGRSPIHRMGRSHGKLVRMSKRWLH